MSTGTAGGTSWSSLAEAGHGVVTPFALTLGQRTVRVRRILRHLPGKRLVADAEMTGKRVLLKLFFHRRHWQQEVDGYRRAAQAGMKTPPLLESFEQESGGVCTYYFLEAASRLDERWRAESAEAVLQPLLKALEAFYSARLLQSDLHLGNFLFEGDALYVLDPASMVTFTGAEARLDNLALLLAQFPLADTARVAAAITAAFSEVSEEALRLRAREQQQKRRKDFLKKIYRDCSAVSAWQKALPYGQHLRIRCARAYADASLRAWLENPATQSANTGFLKRGNSTTVSRCVLGGRSVVVKQYRYKDVWRWLRRCWRRSRASNSWYFSHLLQDAGITIPEPLALVERRWGPLVLESWFVSKYVEATSLLDAWHSREPEAWERAAVENLFACLRELSVSHGDMKATNLLVSGREIYLIDFDGMREHRDRASATRALGKDRQRFLRNWPSG